MRKKQKKMLALARLRLVTIGGWGEASLQVHSTPTGRSFRPVRVCVRAVLFMSNQG